MYARWGMGASERVYVKEMGCLRKGMYVAAIVPIGMILIGCMF